MLKANLALAADLRRFELLDVRVGAVAADAVGVEQADAEDEIRVGWCARVLSRTSIGSPDWNTCAGLPSRPCSVTSVISTSRDPQRPSVAWNMSAGVFTTSEGWLATVIASVALSLSRTVATAVASALASSASSAFPTSSR